MLQKSKRWTSLSSESRSHTAMKVIDRTGPKPRELSSYEEIYDRPLHPEEKLPGKTLGDEKPLRYNRLENKPISQPEIDWLHVRAKFINLPKMEHN